MFDPNKLVSPMRILLNTLYGNLNKLLIHEDNTLVNEWKQDEWYYNTLATVDNTDQQGEVTRLGRSIWYDRVNLPDYIEQISQSYQSGDGELSRLLFSPHHIELQTTPTAKELADCLATTHNLPISEYDLVEKTVSKVNPIPTWFGEVLLRSNCNMADGSITYVAGKLPIKEDGHVRNLNAMTFTKVWSVTEQSKLILPVIDHKTASWSLQLHDVEELNYGSNSRNWATFKADAASGRWKVVVGDNSPIYLDGTKANTVTLTLLQGHVNLHARSSEGVDTNYVSLSRVSVYNRGLLRVTSYSTDPHVTGFAFKFSVKPKEPTDGNDTFTGFSGYINCSEDSTGMVIDDIDPNYIIGEGNGYLSNMTMGGGYYNVNRGIDFTLKASNGNFGRGDYEGLEYFMNPNFIVVAERDRIEADLRDAIANNFSDPNNKVVALGIHVSHDSQVRTMRANGKVVSEKLASAYVPWDDMSITLQPGDNTITYRAATVVNPYDYPESPAEVFDGVLCDNLAQFENPVVILLHLAPRRESIYRFEYESTPLPVIDNTRDYIQQRKLFAASENSNAIFGEMENSILLTNTIVRGYVTMSNELYGPVNTSIVTKGSVSKVFEVLYHSGEGFACKTVIDEIGGLLKKGEVKEVTVTVSNVRSVTSNFKLHARLDKDTGEVMMSVWGNGVEAAKDVVDIDNFGEFEVRVVGNSLQLSYGRQTKVTNTYQLNDPLAKARYNVALSVVTPAGKPLPVAYVSANKIYPL